MMSGRERESSGSERELMRGSGRELMSGSDADDEWQRERVAEWQ